MKVKAGKLAKKELVRREPQQTRLPLKLSELVDLADKENEREYPTSVSDLGPVVDSLLKKHFSWTEISEWLGQRNIHYAAGSLAGGWRKWQEREKAKANPQGEREIDDR